MHKISKQISKGHLTDIMSILKSFFLIFLQKYIVFMFIFTTFCSLKFWFQYFYILVLHEVFGEHKLGSSTISPIGKTESLTVANTLLTLISWKQAFHGLLNTPYYGFGFAHTISIIHLLVLKQGTRNNQK